MFVGMGTDPLTPGAPSIVLLSTIHLVPCPYDLVAVVPHWVQTFDSVFVVQQGWRHVASQSHLTYVC